MCMSVQDACVPTRLSARSDQDKPKEQAERPALFSCADIPQGLPLSRGADPKGLRGEPRRSGHGIPYEGKLSPQATDEVDSVA